MKPRELQEAQDENESDLFRVEGPQLSWLSTEVKQTRGLFFSSDQARGSQRKIERSLLDSVSPLFCVTLDLGKASIY